jgi:sec-independent protein translocase protein TatA
MFAGKLGWLELGLIALALLLLFGAKRIPVLLGSIGEGIRRFRQGLSSEQINADNPADAEKRQARQLEPRSDRR